MKSIGTYVNGNYKVMLFDDGTKIRANNLDYFNPDFPESMDIKITNRCDMNCKMCHEDSIPEGEHGDILNIPFFNTLSPYTELAIGGGNPLSHPNLVEFLECCKEKKLICNITVNEYHFMNNQPFISELIGKGLIYGLGISVNFVTDDFIFAVKRYQNAVLHIINGVVTLDELHKLYDNGLKILILGYKDFRRGVRAHSAETDARMRALYEELPEITKHFDVVSFDNLALRQLNAKRLVTEEQWDNFYMGDDGQFTMYVDMVKREFAQSSVSTKRYPIKDDIRDMFNIVRNES